MSQRVRWFLLIFMCVIGFIACFIYIQSTSSQRTLTDSLPVELNEEELEINADDSFAKPSSKAAIVSGETCPEPQDVPTLVGRLGIDFETPSYDEIAKRNPLLESGGVFRPKQCQARYRVAIIVPYRDRDDQLRAFLNHMHPILQRQLLEYGIFIIEQSGDAKFNRALLMNIGYNESIQEGKWDCFIFHDVDLFVEDDRAPYGCSEGPLHMSGYIDKFEYKLPYKGIFGGISNIPRRHFEMVNGYSNLYFGWGGEDDDMYKRLTHKKFEISRYNRNIMRYKMWKHEHEGRNAANERRFWLLKNTIDRMNVDGLNSLVYRRLDKKRLPTHFLVTVDFSEKEIHKAVFTAG